MSTTWPGPIPNRDAWHGREIVTRTGERYVYHARAPGWAMNNLRGRLIGWRTASVLDELAMAQDELKRVGKA